VNYANTKYATEYVMHYSVGESLCRWLWMKNASYGQHTRVLREDTGITFFITATMIETI
jgi:hypothetical protein